MDSVQALAFFFTGAFLIVLISAVTYALSVRPRLMEPVSLAETGMLDAGLRDELVEQRAVVERLNTALAHHTEQLETGAARAVPGGDDAELDGVLHAQSDAVDQLTALLQAQAEKLAGFDERLAWQDERLVQIASRLERTGMLPVQPDSEDEEQLSDLIQAQAERLVMISTQLDAWGAASARADQTLSEHARILAELDRELATQAESVQRLDTKIGEHTKMLVTAATERREQAGILERLLAQVGQLVPLVNRVVNNPPRPGQDRLTDIKGIGPVYAGKLYEAGIQTYRQLAAMTPDELYTLISEPTWRMRSIDAEHWIKQAQLLASQREKVESIT